MQLDGLQLVIVLVVFLVVLVVGGAGAQARPWRRRRAPDPPIVDETGPYEVPEDDAPTKSDD